MIKKVINPDEAARACALSEHELDSAMTEQPGLMSYYGQLHTSAKKQMDAMKLKRDVVEAQIYTELKDKYATSGAKTTEAQLKNEVTLDPRYIAARKAYIEAEAEEVAAKHVLDALWHKRDMMIAMGRQRETESRLSPHYTATRDAADQFAGDRMR